MSPRPSASVAAARPQPSPRPAPARAHLRVAPDTRRRRRRARLTVLAITVVTVASLFALVSFHVLAAQSAFTLDRLARERANEQLRYERLRDTVARLSAPETVIAAAQQLGMVPAARQHFIRAPAAAPRGAPGDVTPESLSPHTYDATKRALDQNP